MYKIVCIDLDETFLARDYTIPKKNIEAINKARELGVRTVINTGRPFFSAEDVMLQAGLNQPGDFMINCNGAVITNTHTGEIIYSNPLPYHVAEKMVKRGKELNLTVNVMSTGSSNVINGDRSLLNHRDRHAPYQKFINDLSEVTDLPVIKVLLETSVDTSYDDLIAMKKEIEELCEGEAEISYSSGKFLECNHKGIDKGEGMLLLAEKLGVKQEETIAIGDNFNDVSMLVKAGLGVAVKNSRPELFELVDYVCENTCDDAAVAEVIENFILNV